MARQELSSAPLAQWSTPSGSPSHTSRDSMHCIQKIHAIVTSRKSKNKFLLFFMSGRKISERKLKYSPRSLFVYLICDGHIWVWRWPCLVGESGRSQDATVVLGWVVATATLRRFVKGQIWKWEKTTLCHFHLKWVGDPDGVYPQSNV